MTTFTFDPTITFEVIDGAFDSTFDGFGDEVFPGNFDTVVLGSSGENSENAEFDISGFSVPSEEVITSATFQVQISSLEVGGLGVPFGDNPDSLGVLGYVGNGLVDASDFQAGTLINAIDTTSLVVGQVLTFDVTEFVQNLVLNGDSFSGFAVRALEFGGLALSRNPTLTITTETVSSPIAVVGTEGRDILTGSNRGEQIFGLGGNDVIQGLGGNDEIFGDNGNDNIIGGNGRDTVEGGAGNDLIFGDAGNDTLAGNEGRDDISGGDGNDTIDGGNNSDRLNGEAGNDNISGGDSDDIIDGGDGNDTIDGGNGNDRIFGRGDDDNINGNAGNDQIFGNEGNDTVFGGNGNDQIFGGDGNDTILGEVGADILIAGLGNDTLDGGNGNDRLTGVDTSATTGVGLGSGEIDTLTGSSGRDTFVLGDSNVVYYDDGQSLTTGESDYALITDFNFGEDFIQLKGSRDFYSFDFFTSATGTIDAALIFDPGVTARGEVIGILQNASLDLNISSRALTFV
jgi:Ca2+-binding RTX toxin-like protein